MNDNMIPSVDNRSIRICDICHCYWEAECSHDGVGCTLNLDVFDERGSNFMFINKKEDKEKYAKQHPCRCHMTHKEYQELIDSGKV